MKDFILRSKSLMLILFIGVLFSCSKEKPKTLLSEPTKVDANSTISERQNCCGTVHIFNKDPSKPILGVPFQIWYPDQNHSWQHTNCIPANTISYDLALCHDSEDLRTLFILPCTPGQPIPPPNNKDFDPFNGNTYDLRVAKTNACGNYYYNPACLHWFFGPWPQKFWVNPPPIPVGNAGGYSLEISLCCY